MTSIRLTAGEGRARLDLTADALVPRVIETTSATARVALVAGQALLLGSDRVRLDISVGAGCVLELDDIGGTVAYDADDEESSWITDITVERDAVLLWKGLPLVVSTGANVLRSTRIRLAANARACIRETIVLGRSGEHGGRLTLRTDVTQVGEPLFVEELTVDGAHPVPGVLDDSKVLDSVLCVGARMPAQDSLRVLELEGAGSLARQLGASAHTVDLDSVWSRWRDLLLA